MALNNPGIIAHPPGYLQEAFPATGQQAAKGVAHDVGCYPWHFLVSHVGLERSDEVVTIAAFASLNVGSDAVLAIHGVFLEKVKQDIGHRDGASLPVFGGECVRFLDEDRTGLEVEPTGPGLDDFIATHPCLEPGVNDKSKDGVFGILEKLVPKFRVAELHPVAVVPFFNPDGLGGVLGQEVLLHHPVEEGPDCHQVALGRRADHAFAFLFIPCPDIGFCDACREDVAHFPAEAKEGQGLVLGGEPGELLVGQFFGDEALYFIFQTASSDDLGSLFELQGSLDGFGLTLGFQGNSDPMASLHAAPVPPPPFLVETFDFHAGSKLEGGRVANLGSKCIAEYGRIRGNMSFRK